MVKNSEQMMAWQTKEFRRLLDRLDVQRQNVIAFSPALNGVFTVNIN